MIPFNKYPSVADEMVYMRQALSSGKLCGDQKFTRLVENWFVQRLGEARVLMTPSCTAALEMTAMLLNIGVGDEVIMPSFTFVSTANAFALRGARIRFVDIHPDTLNIDPQCIEAAISERTKAVVPVHYAGVSCDMAAIGSIAARHGLYTVEDAAQAVMSKYRGKYAGTFGDMGTFSFHETKNFTSGGEGGLLVISNIDGFSERAEIIREKGTNRSMFFRGEVDKYSWVDIGSSYLPGELQAAHLYAQLQRADEICRKRMQIWNLYEEGLRPLADRSRIELPVVPAECEHNAHMFYIKCAHLEDRTALIRYLREKEVYAVFHYVPLHSSAAGKKYGLFVGEDRHTTKESERIVRLPLFYNLDLSDAAYIVSVIHDYFANR